MHIKKDDVVTMIGYDGDTPCVKGQYNDDKMQE